MSWQDSFVPDGQAAPAVQAQGWQSSFVPDSNSQQPESTALPQAQSTLPNPTAQDSSVSENQQMTPAQKMYEYFSDKPGKRYGNIVPLSYKESTGTTSTAFPEIIRSPARGLAELLGQSAGEYPLQTDTSPSKSEGLSPDQINALTLLSPVSPASHSVAFGQQLAQGAENLVKGASDVLPDAFIDEYSRTNQQEPAISPTNSDLKLITKKLELAGITPQQYAEALTKSSPDEFAGEVGGDPLRIQAQTYAKLQGPTMQTARDAMRQRLQEAPQRVGGLIENTFMPQPTIERYAQNIADMGQQLPALYDAADKDIVTRRPFLNTLNTPAGQTAMKATVEKFANQGVNPQEAGIIIDPNSGFHSFEKKVPVSTVHEFSKSLGDQVQRNPLTNAVEGSDSATIEGMRQGVTSSLAENSPAFAKANAVAAAQKQAQSAFDAGRKLAGMSAGDNADQLMERAEEIYSPNELAYHKAGFAQGLKDKIQGAPLGTGNPATRIASGNMVLKAGEVLDNPSQAKSFGDSLVREKQMMDFANKGLNNSVTAETASAGLPEIPTSVHGAAMSAASKIGDFLNSGKNDRMSQLLFALSPEQKSALADAVIKYNK